MASWLKVAEDLLEVVDRRAKLVVSELSDEQSDSQASGQEVQAKKTKSKGKGKLQSSIKTSKSLKSEPDQQSKKSSVPNVESDKVIISQSDGSTDTSVNDIGESLAEPPSDDSKETARSDTENQKGGNDLTNEVEFQITENELETRISSENDGTTFDNLTVELESSSSLPFGSKGIGTINGDAPPDADADAHVNAVNDDNSSTVIQERPEYETTERRSISNSQEIGREILLEPSPTGDKQQEGKTSVLPEPSPNGILLQENETDALPKPSPNRNKQQEDKTDALPESPQNGNMQHENKTNALLEQSHDQNKQQENTPDVMSEPSPKKNKQQEKKADVSPMEVQAQLNEAQGLLKSAVKTGQSKEARLARVCAGLSSRLQEYKTENAQLEELLAAERELSGSYEARIKQLQQELSASKTEVAKVESNLTDALAAKNSEIEALTGSMDALKKKAAAAEEKLAFLQTDMETIRRSRELTENRMIQALREELASVERRAEDERAAHSATKMAAVEREIELEHRAVEASNALARIQRTAEESTSRATELEHKVALLEVECASLNQELQELEARNRRGQKKSSEEASQILQVQAWQDEVERARQGQREAENKLSSLEAELQKMRVEIAGMKRDAEHYSRQEHMELEKRYRELTDLLYHKQTQLETMTSEKAALEFQLEKEIKRLREVQVEAERSRAVRRASSSWEEDTDLKALEPLPLHHRHMVGASIQLQRAAKLLDSGAVRATKFLWRYPYARVILLFYLVFVHLFLMYLLHRLQEQADSFASREVAVSMGLGNSSLP